MSPTPNASFASRRLPHDPRLRYRRHPPRIVLGLLLWRSMWRMERPRLEHGRQHTAGRRAAEATQERSELREALDAERAAHA
jgi:hypothetical protein